MDVAEAIAKVKEEQMQKDLAEAKADAKNLEIFNDCLSRYTAAMRTQLIENGSFYSKSHLNQIHENTKINCLSKVKFVELEINYEKTMFNILFLLISSMQNEIAVDEIQCWKFVSKIVLI